MQEDEFATFSGNNAALLALTCTIFPATLNSHSEGTKVATISKYFWASLAKFGSTRLRLIHQLSGLSLRPMGDAIL